MPKTWCAVLLLAALLPACARTPDVADAQPPSPTPEAPTTPAGPGIEEALAEKNLQLPQLGTPTANFVRAVRTGDLVFLAGHGPMLPEGGFVAGRLGDDLTIEQGYEAAKLTCLALLSSLKAEIGDLDKVHRIVRVFGMVNSTPDFKDHSKVINGCSDVLVELYGDAGRHARAAVGMASLPVGFAVEIEMVVEVRD